MKKIILTFLVVIMMSTLCVFAAEGEQQKAVNLVSQLGIMRGDIDGSMRLNDTLTRAEFSKIAIASSIYQNSVATNLPISPFRDVPYTHWAAPYIRVALNNKLVAGYTDATFQPDNPVLYEEALTVALKLLGYTETDFGQSWPYGQINLAKSIGLSDNMAASAGQNITRSDAAILIYNLLNCKPNNGTTKYIEKLGYKYYDNITITGIYKIDPTLEPNEVKTAQGTFTAENCDPSLYSRSGDMLVNSKYEIMSFNTFYNVISVNDNNWENKIGISDASNLTITRDSNIATINDIQINDIVYYFKNSNILKAYSKKITGIYESATPNKDYATSISVSGTSYKIETYEAYKELSSGGKFNYGDTVTLLIGVEGNVAGVISPNETNKTDYGYIYGTGKKDFTDSNGNTYSSYYIDVALTNGETYEYASVKDYSDYVNTVALVKFDQGKAVISVQRGESNLYGTFDVDSKKLGSFDVSDDVEILDVSTTESNVTGSYVSVFPQRLDGVKLNSKDILFYEKNEKDEICKLILNNVTGDAYQYGLVLKASSNTGGNSVNGSYTYDLNGTTNTYNSSGITFPVSAGQPVRLVLTGSKISRIDPITKIDKQVTNVTNTYIEAGSQKYLLADKVVVYKKTNYDTFMVIPLSDIIGSQDGTITAYYDKPIENGGRVRILILWQ